MAEVNMTDRSPYDVDVTIDEVRNSVERVRAAAEWQERTRAIRETFNDEFNRTGRVPARVESVRPNFIVFRREGRTYRLGYTMNEADGSVLFDPTDPVEVKLVITPVKPQTQKAAAAGLPNNPYWVTVQ